MRRAGQLAMTTQVFKDWLNIPEDTDVRDIWIDHKRDIVYILVENGEWLPIVPEAGVPPEVVQPYVAEKYSLDME